MSYVLYVYSFLHINLNYVHTVFIPEQTQKLYFHTALQIVLNFGHGTRIISFNDLYG